MISIVRRRSLLQLLLLLSVISCDPTSRRGPLSRIAEQFDSDRSSCAEMLDIRWPTESRLMRCSETRSDSTFFVLAQPEGGRVFEAGYVVAGADSTLMSAQFSAAVARFTKEMGPGAALCDTEGRVDGYRWQSDEYGVNVTRLGTARMAVAYSLMHAINEPLCSAGVHRDSSVIPR